jgi:VanZ family protein
MKDWISENMSGRNLVIALLACYATVAVLSLVPEMYRPHVPGVSDTLEHIVAYALLAFLTATLLGSSVALPVIFGVIVAYAGLLEVGQTLVPCRSASLKDFAASGIGALIGVTASSYLRPLIRA